MYMHDVNIKRFSSLKWKTWIWEQKNYSTNLRMKINSGFKVTECLFELFSGKCSSQLFSRRPCILDAVCVVSIIIRHYFIQFIQSSCWGRDCKWRSSKPGLILLNQSSLDKIWYKSHLLCFYTWLPTTIN